MKPRLTTSIALVAATAACMLVLFTLTRPTAENRTAKDLFDEASRQASQPQPAAAAPMDKLPEVAAGNSEVEHDRAAIGFLHAIISKDQAQLSLYRALLLETGAAIPSALSRFLNCGIVDVEVETMRLLIQTRSTRAIAMVLGRMLSLDLSAPGADRYTEVFAECRDYAVGEWLVDCLASDDDGLSRRAAILLSILNGPETTVAIALDSPAPLEDRISLMSERKDISEVDSLIAVFLETEHAVMREAAAFSLATIGSAPACKFLIKESLTEGDSANVARAALRTVTSSFSQRALLEAAVDSRLPEETRVAAVTALHMQKSDHVALQLANLDVTPENTELEKAVDVALSSYNKEKQSQHSKNVVADNYEICF